MGIVGSSPLIGTHLILAFAFMNYSFTARAAILAGQAHLILAFGFFKTIRFAPYAATLAEQAVYRP